MKKLQDIDEFNALFRQSTSHPLVSVADLSKADLSLFDPTDFGMYCVVLMDACIGRLTKDGQPLHYDEGTIFTMMPGQTMELQLDYSVYPRGWMLAFRPELLVKTGLGRDFYMFNFFSANATEALRLSPTERGTIVNCFANIFAELHTPADNLSGHMLRLGIGQLLSYCKRFYERQFMGKSAGVSNLLQRLDTLIDNYLGSGLPEQKGQPTVAWCAAQFDLSPNYFGDLVKRELRITAQEYVQGKIIDAAKRLLRNTNMSVAQISEQLGFAYSNHFTRMFHKKVGYSPMRYRKVATGNV
ncbi:MAG: helix-turn-helix transcriptional regulator [Bacteroidaceae bacterium]|nr:helix-turn-helix transcriptional regulator [Bacteroidaceae bacterium]